LYLAAAGACLLAHVPLAVAGITTPLNEIVVYDLSEGTVDKVTAPAPNPSSGVLEPGLYETDTPGKSNMPLLVIEPSQFFHPYGAITVSIPMLNLLVQNKLVVSSVVGVDQQTDRLAFWSDGDAGKPTDVLSAFQTFGIGSAYQTVLVEVRPTNYVDVSAYVNLPLNARFLSDGGVPEASSFVIWALLGTGGMMAGWWQRRRAKAASLNAHAASTEK